MIPFSFTIIVYILMQIEIKMCVVSLEHSVRNWRKIFNYLKRNS